APRARPIGGQRGVNAAGYTKSYDRHAKSTNSKLTFGSPTTVHSTEVTGPPEGIPLRLRLSVEPVPGVVLCVSVASVLRPKVTSPRIATLRRWHCCHSRC